MRVFRILLLILFIITAAVFGVNQYLSYQNRDNKAPVISSNQDVLHLSVKATDEDYLRGVIAEDDHDGDVTSTLVVSGKSNFIEEGVIRVDYAAFDSHNNVGTYSRKIIFDDYYSPRFSSKSALVLRSGTSHDFSFFEAEDVLNGDISNKIKILTNTYSTGSSSEYPIEIEVTNSYGDVAKLDLVLDVLTGIEYNNLYPALSEYIVYLPIGDELDYSSYLIGIRQGDNFMDFEEAEVSKEEIKIEDYVDYNFPGVYNVVFSLWQSYTLTTETKMVVIVTEDF